MSDTIKVIQNRRSVRAYQNKAIDRDTTELIIHSAMRAPTAGNMMLYSIVEIDDQELKEKLAKSCDNQHFIAKAPLVLLFLADYQRWFDYFLASDVASLCESEGKMLRFPSEGDLLLACCDALIAAQTAVIAAEALGVGSCYIGDIMENYEYHRELLDLPQYTFPITLLCFGYPSASAAKRELQPRYSREAICFKDRYRRLDEAALARAFEFRGPRRYSGGARNFGQHVYSAKFAADFTVELNRSVREAIRAWTEPRASITVQ